MDTFFEQMSYLLMKDTESGSPDEDIFQTEGEVAFDSRVQQIFLDADVGLIGFS